MVSEQDGTRVHQVAELSDFVGWRHESVRLLDDNIMAKSDVFIATCEQLAKLGLKVSFDALDIRLVTDETAEALALTTPVTSYRFAFDCISYEADVVRGIELLSKVGIKPWRLLFYVLIGHNSTEDDDLHRVELLRRLGANPFASPINKTDPYQKRFARWVNHKAIFKSVPWKDYR